MFSSKLRKSVLVAGVMGMSFACARAQQSRSNEPSIDVAVTYIGQRSVETSSSQNFWSQGGSIELAVNAWRGLGIAADVTGTHAGSIASSGVPLSMVTATFGPRYRWRAQRKLSLYGEALLGEANGFRSLFPSSSGAQSSANSMALQIGGGVDLRISTHLAVRALDAGWLRTQLPNSTTNVQNSLRLGTGVVLRF